MKGDDRSSASDKDVVDGDMYCSNRSALSSLLLRDSALRWVWVGGVSYSA